MKDRITGSLLESLQPAPKPFEVWDTAVRSLVLRVQPSGVMTYFCVFTTPERRSRIRIGDAKIISPSVARSEAQKIQAAILTRKIDPIREKQALKTDSLRAYLRDHYLPWTETHQRGGRENVERIERCFAEILDRRLIEITPWVIEKWRSQRIKAGTSKNTVNRDVATLRAALSKAREWKFVPHHPLQDLKPLKIDNVGVVRYLSRDEEARLRAALDAREARIRAERANANLWRRERGYPEFPDLGSTAFADYLKPAVILSLNTGVRQGELFKLEWESVDLEGANLTLVGHTTKANRTRHIPLNREALEVLRGWARDHGNPPTGIVFPSSNGTVRVDAKTAWAKVLQNAKITGYRWHDLRHDFASRLAMAGVELNVIRELLGHASLTMTLRYSHLSPATKAAAVAKLDARIEPEAGDQIQRGAS